MNAGLVGFPALPSRRSRVERIDALAGTIGTPIARIGAYHGRLAGTASAVQVASIKATASLWAIAYCPVDDSLYACANTADGQVVVASPAAQRVVRSFHVGASPVAIEYAPSIARLLILLTDGTLVVYDPRRRLVERKVATGVASATSVVFAPSNGKAHVFGSASAGAVVNLSTWACAGFVAPAGVQAAVYRPSGDAIWVACTGGLAPYFVASGAMNPVAVATTDALHHLAFDPTLDAVMATSRTASSLRAVAYSDVSPDNYTEIINPPNPVGALCFSPAQRALFLSYSAGLEGYDDKVYGRNEWASPLTCGLARDIAFCPSDQRMYAVSDAGAAEIAVIA